MSETIEAKPEENGKVRALARKPKPEQLPVAATPMQLISLALSRGDGMDIVAKLFDMQERFEKNEARKAFDEAIAAAKSEIPPIIKNRTVSFDTKTGGRPTTYKHEDLAEIARTVDPILGRHGLSYRWRTSSTPNEPITVICIVSHRLGHWEENPLCAGRDDSGSKNSIQQIGSTITYLQRYTLKAALGLAASNDDDGNSAGKDATTITAEQIEEIRKKIIALGLDIPKFCKVMKVGKIEDIAARDFGNALRMFKEYEDWMKKQPQKGKS